MTYIEQVLRENFPNYKEMIKELLDDYSKQSETGKQEESAMKVSYKGVTGRIKKLVYGYNKRMNKEGYTLEIDGVIDENKRVFVFENVDVSEIKFIGATVTLA